MSYTLKGEVKVINETVTVSDKFKKREFVVTDKGEYPQTIMFQLVQDKCSILDQFNVGDEVEVFFNLRGREWTSPKNEVKYFNTLDAWKIQPLDREQPKEQETFVAEGDDDLPF